MLRRTDPNVPETPLSSPQATGPKDTGAAAPSLAGGSPRRHPRDSRAAESGSRDRLRDPVADPEGVPLRPEFGAAIERQLLLASSPEDRPAGPLSPRPRRIGWILGVAFLLAAIGSGVFFFLQARTSWEARVATLRTDLARTTREASEREEALRLETRTKDQEIAERKRESSRVASLAEETLRQLRESMEDFRKVREEKQALEVEHRRLLRERRSPVKYLLDEWVPRWAARAVDGEARAVNSQ